MSKLRSLISLAPVAIILLVAGLCFAALQKPDLAAKSSEEISLTSLESNRLVHRLQSLTIAYELTINEYYSTVINLARYKEKSSALRLAIDSELAKLAKLPGSGNINAAKEIQRLTAEIDTFRISFDRALDENNQDWDAARESLFKINILSAQAIELAAKLAESSKERTILLNETLHGYHQNIMMILIAAIASTLLLGIFALRNRKLQFVEQSA
jgi:hypothetical protein